MKVEFRFIDVKPEPDRLIPTLRFTVEARNPQPGTTIELLGIHASARTHSPMKPIYLGYLIPTDLRNIHEEEQIDLLLELGWSNVSAVEEERKDEDVWFFIQGQIVFALIHSRKADESGRKYELGTFEKESFEVRQPPQEHGIKIPESDWKKWLTSWTKTVRTVTIHDAELVKKFEELKKKLKASDEEIMEVLLLSYEEKKAS